MTVQIADLLSYEKESRVEAAGTALKQMREEHCAHSGKKHSLLYTRRFI